MNSNTDLFIKTYIKNNQDKLCLYDICFNLIVTFFFYKEDIEYVYYFFFNKNIDINNLETKKLTTLQRQRLDQKFKSIVKSRYNYCVISGYHSMQCEIAHIIPFSQCNDIDKYNPNNGILLSCELHKLFDNGAFKIDPNTMQIEINETIDNIEELAIYKYKNKKINIHKSSIPFLHKLSINVNSSNII